MHRYLLTLLLLSAGTAAWAQDSAPEKEAAAPESRETAEQAPAEADDESDVEEGNYLDAEEEDFVPSEDIPADQSIPFPTDI
ncbi:MAG TPA: hypothetical protein VLS87_05445 [Woeseiaceae bacterium]|nr:hypothetical protein [Woeseiaceae bacterium]